MKPRIVVAGLLMLVMATAQAARAADDQPIEAQVVDALNKAFGVHPGFRANHAKGVVVEGNFKASPAARTVSQAAIFTGAAIPITVRFSDSTGIPNIPDGADGANPHGMSIKYHLPDGGETDMVINSLKFFLVSSGEEFRDLFLAIADSPPNAPKPTKLDQFVAAHPAIPAALATIATPDSFADEEYFGLDAFVFVDKAGKRQAVRYQMVPTRLVHLPPADAAKRAPDFLVSELPERLKHGPVTFHLKAQLAAAGDQTIDPTKAWPDSRTVLDLGVLTITRAVPDSDEAQKKLLFLPTNLIDGIEASDDPLLPIRTGAYAVSFSRRNP
ncbi:MAG: catalase [Acetobacteraceae bacterium]|jgi:catalase|nr:catalase [Acetobacteraceae bacterium]